MKILISLERKISTPGTALILSEEEEQLSSLPVHLS